MSAKDHWIKTGRDGVLDGTSPTEVERIANRVANADKVVIHLHGGLVSDTKATAKAKELIPEYQSVDADPVFFIYRTGLLEIIRNNLHEIAREKIFKKLSKKLLKYAVGKLTTPGGAKAAGGLDMPGDLEVAIEYKGTEQNHEPYENVQPITSIKELTKEEESLFTDDLATDVEFQIEVQSIVNGATPDQYKETVGSKGTTISNRTSSETLMSPEVVNELVQDAQSKDGKGILSTGKLIYRAGKVLREVIKRYVKKRDHGLHATVVEELLRELYLANIGAAVWKTMKKETADTFQQSPDGSVRGGRYFVEALGQALASTARRPQFTIVAHSLGSVFACNLIEHLALAKKNPKHPLPKDFKIRNLIFLAPAAEFEVFATTLRKYRSEFDNFRMFALGDDLESGYWEVPVVYPRSLLYFVSGAFEETSDEKSAFDRPLVGMQRYINEIDVYKSPDVKKVRDFLDEEPDRMVWSVSKGKPGFSSDAIRHGGFDDAVFKPGDEQRRATVDSILHMIGA